MSLEQNWQELLLENIEEGVVFADTEGKISLINNQAREITGYSSGVTGKDIDVIFGDRVPKRSGQVVVESKNGEKKLLFIKVIEKKNGEKGFLFSEHKKIDEQYVLSLKLESIGQLAAGIAHEINTPMQYIGDNLSFLQKGFQVLLPKVNNGDVKTQHLKEEIPRAIDDALTGVKRVNKLVSAMKNFAHPGQQEKETVNLNESIENTVEITRNEWKHLAELDLNLEQGLPSILGMRDEINQVLLNIIINAAQAISEAREKNIISRGKIEIETGEKEGNVFVLIKDNGIGIPVDIQDKIFDPFFTTKEVGQGTGQGLALAHDVIVKKHGGYLGVNSKPEKGATFIIELPVRGNR